VFLQGRWLDGYFLGGREPGRRHFEAGDNLQERPDVSKGSSRTAFLQLQEMDSRQEMRVDMEYVKRSGSILNKVMGSGWTRKG